ncbi:kinase-like domain-containing protein [Phaeosphaeriaceae sp. PMI808]|nr:kinase-like domain-containing protein [Phaeosphaeriaceae sp. PMI808]
MEYIPRTLAQTPIDKRLVPRGMTHLCSALECLDQHGLMHRDVKPDNVLVTGEYVFKLVDFGTSKRNTVGLMESFVGTLNYIAPEMFSEPLCYTGKVDMWFVGLIGLQLFTTWHPLSDKAWNPGDSEGWIQHVLPSHVALVPATYRPVVEGCLQPSPDHWWSASQCLTWLQESYHITEHTCEDQDEAAGIYDDEWESTISDTTTDDHIVALLEPLTPHYDDDNVDKYDQ